jgi:hypothetical protein
MRVHNYKYFLNWHFLYKHDNIMIQKQNIEVNTRNTYIWKMYKI